MAPVLISGSTSASLGVQTAGSAFTAKHQISSTWSNPSGNGSAKCVSSTNWSKGDYYQFKVSTSNFSDIKLSFDMRSSNTGPSTFKLQYGLNDSTFRDFGPAITVANTSWSKTSYNAASNKSFDLSSLVQLNDQPYVYFRIVDSNTVAVNGSLVASGGTSSIDNFTVTGSSLLQLNVKAFLEGYYVGNSTMTPTLRDLNLSTDPTATDTVTVNLWPPDSISVAGSMPSYSIKGILRTNGNLKVIIPKITLGKSYYLALKHRNSIEIWSANPVLITESTNYDFTTGLNKAFSVQQTLDLTPTPVMRYLEAGVYALYSGDVNQEGAIDLLDMQATENDAYAFYYGYNSTDCNGDGATDALDMQIIENNAALYLYLVRPQ